MKSSKIAFVVGAIAAFALGVSAEACSSSSSTGTTPPGNDAGSGTGTGTGGHKGMDSGTSGTGTSPMIDSGMPGTGSGSGAKCYKPPVKLHPEMATVSIYCPFSEVGDGGKDMNCTAGQACCVTPAGTSPSTCVSTATCPVTGSTRVACEGTPDCAGMGVCCGYGAIATQPAQPNCGDAGYPASQYVSGFNYGPSGVKGSGGTFCAATCTTKTPDGGPVPTFQICSQTSECVSGATCIAIEPSGVGLGYCALAGSLAAAPSATPGSGTGSGTGTGSDAGTATDAHAG
jgi:hypothetical protein